MNVIVRILLGAVIAAAGAFFVVKTQKVLDVFGAVDWAEQKLGGGGSRLFYKLLGIVFILIGFVVMTNMWNAFLESTVGSFIPAPE